MNAESPLAPELTRLVRQAQADLERSVTEAKLHDDPIRFPLAAISTTLEAIHRLFVDGSLALAQAAKASQSEAAASEIGRFTSDMRKELPRVIREGTWNGTQRVLDGLQAKHMLLPVGTFIAGAAVWAFLSWLGLVWPAQASTAYNGPKSVLVDVAECQKAAGPAQKDGKRYCQMTVQ